MPKFKSQQIDGEKYADLESAAIRATLAWLDNDSEANHVFMRIADTALAKAKAANQQPDAKCAGRSI